MSPLRLRLDAASCTGHGICALVCPERVALDEWGFPDVDPEPLDTRAELRHARFAVATCPEGALSLEDGPSPDPAGRGKGR